MASNSEQPIQWSDFAVKSTIHNQITKANQGVSAGEELLSTFTSVGGLLKAAGDDEKFNAVREATIRMLQARHELDVHSQALSHLHGGYHATGETTNFKAELANNAEQLEESNPYDPASDPLVHTFDQETGAVGPQDEQIDGEIAIAGESTHQMGRNNRCPLTGKELMELENPVADAMNFIYERSAIEHYLKQAKGSVKCPVAGTGHTVTLQELKPAIAVIAAKRKGGRQKKKHEEEDAGEVLELD